jgi:hypothetical protein
LDKRGRLSPTLLFGRSALCLLAFLRCLPLLLGGFLNGFLVLLGRFVGEAGVLFGALILGASRQRACNSQGDQQYESRDSFHNFSERKVFL